MWITAKNEFGICCSISPGWQPHNVTILYGGVSQLQGIDRMEPIKGSEWRQSEAEFTCSQKLRAWFKGVKHGDGDWSK